MPDDYLMSGKRNQTDIQIQWRKEYAPHSKEKLMQFLMIYTPDDATPPSPEKMMELGKFGEDAAKAGKLVATGGMFPSSFGARVRLAEGKFTVTDGPFPEAKEVMAGWVIINVNSKEEAIEEAHRFMTIAGDGEGEIMQLTDSPPTPQG
jgi:hypothetical protein